MVNGRMMFGVALLLGVAIPSEAHAQDGPVEVVLDAIGDLANHSGRALAKSWDDAHWSDADYDAWRTDMNFRYSQWDLNPDLQVDLRGPRCPIVSGGEFFDCEPWEPGGLEDEFSLGRSNWSAGYSIDLRGKAIPFREENLVFGLTLKYTY